MVAFGKNTIHLLKELGLRSVVSTPREKKSTLKIIRPIFRVDFFSFFSGRNFLRYPYVSRSAEFLY